MADQTETINKMVAEGVPFNRLLGLKVTQVDAEHVEARLPEKPEHLNHVGTTHAAAQFSLGEAASGAMIAATFGKELAAGVTPLATEASIKYNSPASGELHAFARLPKTEQDRARHELDQKGRTRLTIKVELIGVNEQVNSELNIEWILLKPKPAK